MNFEPVENVLNINVEAIMTVAMAALLLLLGYWVKRKITILDKYCIPAPVVGGFIFMFVTWAGHVSGTFTFHFTSTFQAPFMLAFFTTVGLGASAALLKKGGLLLILYWLICGAVSIIQNALGVSLASVTGLDAAYGLLCGAITMLGGHGAGLAYGGTFQELGYSAGTLVGAAAATFGLISGGLVGGPIARRLIVKNNLTPDPEDHIDTSVEKVNMDTGQKLTSLDIMKNVTAILFCMAVGTMVSGWIGKLIGMSFPTYVGAMFVAIIVRNLNEYVHIYTFDYPLVERIGDVTLGLFLAMALMTLKLWELAGLAGPMLVILLTQVVVLSVLAYFVVFRILGSNYDAAVMISGLMGHGLGATPTAIVNMSAVTEHYGMSHRAFMIVPIVGAFLVDIIYQPVTIWFIRTFVPAYTGG